MYCRLMTQDDAIKLLDRAASAHQGKIAAFQTIADRIGAPLGTVYHWWRQGKIPAWRLPAFDALKKKRKAA